MNRLSVLIALLLLLPLHAAAETISVRLVKAEQDHARRYVNSSGFVQAHLRWQAAAEVSGRLEKLTVEIGDKVRRGDVLAVIDNPTLVARLRRAEVAVESCDLELSRNLAWREAQAELDVAAARRDLALARVAVAEAEDTFLRKQKLTKRGGSSAHELELHRVARDKALAQASFAEASLKLAEAKLTAGDWKNDLEQCRIEKERALIERDEARSFADRRTIQAPFDGIVSQRFAEPGTQLGPGTPLLELLDPSRLRILAHLADRDMASVRSGQSADVFFDDGSQAAAKLSRLAPERDARGGFAVHLDLACDTDKLGRFANVRILVEERSDAWFVPRVCLLERNGAHCIYQVEEAAKAELREVTVGIEEDQRVEIREGLDPLRPIVAEGVRNVSPGSLLHVTGEE